MKGLPGSIDDRLAFEVERGVEQYGDSGRPAEGLDQPIVPRVLLSADRLEPAGAIDVSDGRDCVPLVFFTSTT